MKKDFVLDQVITIKIPADPTRPAEVKFTAGPYADEAKRLARIPGSGWIESVVDCLPEEISVRLVPDGARVIMKTDEPPTRFIVDRRILTPKPLRKPRPDASERMSAYNEAKKAPAPQEKHTMDFKKYKEELMKDPEFAKAYEELGPEMDEIRSALDDLRSAIDEELREALAEAEQAPAPTKK